MSIQSKISSIPSVWDGFDFTLSHFSADNSLEPRTMSTKLTDNCQISLRHDEIPSVFYRAGFLDCKMSAYPSFKKEFYKDPRNCYVCKCFGIVPDFLFIDLDRGKFNNQMALLNEALKFTLRNINEKFHGRFKPTILWSGNGYHVYLPVQLSGPSWCLGHVDKFCELSKYPDRDFLRWAEQYLSGGNADPEHSKTLSFKNMMLRIPGSINTKANNQRVRIVQPWDGQRPYINWILREFYHYLVNKKLKPPKKKRRQKACATVTRPINSTNWSKVV
jgi:hypothetical protein